MANITGPRMANIGEEEKKERIYEPMPNTIPVPERTPVTAPVEEPVPV